MWVWSLGQEDALEVGIATHSSIPAWRIPWTEKPDRLQSMGLQSQTWLKQLSNTCTWNHALFFVLCISCLILLSQLYCEVVAINPFLERESWGLEKLSNLPKGTQESSDRFQNGALTCSGSRSLDILSIPLLFSKLRVTGFSRWYFVL